MYVCSVGGRIFHAARSTETCGQMRRIRHGHVMTQPGCIPGAMTMICIPPMLIWMEVWAENSSSANAPSAIWVLTACGTVHVARDAICCCCVGTRLCGYNRRHASDHQGGWVDSCGPLLHGGVTGSMKNICCQASHHGVRMWRRLF